MNSFQKSDIFILIPAYNEASKIGDVVRCLQEHGYQNILVINDGSKDQTAIEAQKAGATVLSLIINRGQGAALRTGLSFLAEHITPRAIITFDADGQHQAKDIDKMIAVLEEDQADIVLGSRFLEKGQNVPFIRYCILKMGILFTNVISDVSLTDTHNGFRALNETAYKNIEIFHRGMEHASDIIEEISKKKLRYKEVPVDIVYTDYSKIKGQKTSNFIKIAIKVILKKLL